MTIPTKSYVPKEANYGISSTEAFGYFDVNSKKKFRSVTLSAQKKREGTTNGRPSWVSWARGVHSMRPCSVSDYFMREKRDKVPHRMVCLWFALTFWRRSKITRSQSCVRYSLSKTTKVNGRSTSYKWEISINGRMPCFSLVEVHWVHWICSEKDVS